MKSVMQISPLLRAFALVIILGGCAVGPNLTEHEIESRDAYQNDTLEATSAELPQWENLFNDPVLDSLIKVALDTNRNLLIAARRVEQARLQARITKGNFGPKFNVDGSVGRGTTFLPPLDVASDNFFLGTSMAWELDFWGKYRRLNQNAKAAYLSSEYAQKAIQISLISEVANQYITLLELEQSLRIAEQTLELRTNTLEIIEARFNRGIIPEIDLNQSQIQHAIAEASVPLYEKAVLQTQIGLSFLLGQMPDSIETGLTVEEFGLENELPPGIPADLLGQRPDIQQSWYDAVAQNALIGAAQANRFPAISLTGALGLAGNDFSAVSLSNPAWSVGAGIFAPLFYWNQNLRRVQIERAGTEAALLNYENTVLAAMAEVESSLVEVDANADIILSLEKREAAALNALELSDQRYTQGVTSYLEYLESQRQAFDSQLALTTARADLLRAYVQLYRSLGGGWN